MDTNRAAKAATRSIPTVHLLFSSAQIHTSPKAPILALLTLRPSCSFRGSTPLPSPLPGRLLSRNLSPSRRCFGCRPCAEQGSFQEPCYAKRQIMGLNIVSPEKEKFLLE